MEDSVLIEELSKRGIKKESINLLLEKKQDTRKGKKAKDTMSQRKERSLPSKQELQEFFKAARMDDRKKYTICLLMLGTGLRPEVEAMKLKPHMIDFPRVQFLTVEGKQGKIKEVPLHNALYTELKTYIKEEKLSRDDKLFNFTARTLQLAIKKYKEEAGIVTEMTPYTFRYYFNTLCVDGGMPDTLRRLLMGHNIDYSGGYYKPTPDKKLEAVNKVFSNFII